MHDLPDDAGRVAIRDGDFPTTITSQPHVAVVMTQNWCGDWKLMHTWLKRMENEGRPTDRDIEVYLLVYNKVRYFTEFLHYKENTFGNRLIPYVRYYSAGSYLGDSNQLSADKFLARFG